MGKVGTVADTPLTPAERRALVEKPFPTFQVVGHSRSWAGTSVIDWCEDKPTRAHSGYSKGGLRWLKTPDV